MTALLLISVAVLGSESGNGTSGWECRFPVRVEQDQRMPAPESARRDPRPGLGERDLWSGTPIAMPEGDLVRRPLMLLELRPRSVLWAEPSIEDSEIRRIARQSDAT
jgi:hypothetical protein